MFTIKQIADILGVKKATAYGLVRFLEDKGAVTTTTLQTGLRGKPQNLYSFSQVPTLDVASTLSPLFEAIEKIPAPTAVEATEANVAA